MRDNYTNLPGFEYASLEGSYVLDITVRPAVLSLQLDLLLLPGHPSYGAPLPGDRACFRQATIVFSPVQELHWTGQGVVKPAIDASGTLDFGSVDSLTRDEDNYRLLGDWGTILLKSSTPSLSIVPSPSPDPDKDAQQPAAIVDLGGAGGSPF
ncbi:hypothetical protein [Streptomyces sp. NRRL B-24085]|uniref:hypothetical protein n=1 Tax=Streptomyces sp. NRRL B-24085 TaxID=1709476 RepID=UPI0006B39E52|nr:hypothetical protein [Streptomyces sp. NRRL B-24085]